MFELLGGEIPFLCSSLNSAAEWIRLHRQGPNWSLVGHASAQARAICQRMLNCDERMRPTAQQCLIHACFKAEAEAATEAPTEAADMASGDSSEAVRGDAEMMGRLRAELDGYQGRSKVEKAVLLQVASQAHMSQIGHVADVFQQFDSDKNGSLQQAELVAALKELGVETADAESYATCLDVDGNGRVEYTEFCAACIGLLYESLRGLLWQSFCVIDVDGNGVLKREEILAVVSRAELVAHGFREGADSCGLSEWLDGMEVDESGHISFDELCRHLLPSRPALPSPRNMAGSDEGWPPGAAGPAAVQAVRDEEFAQLLDEIEADHAKVGSRNLSRENLSKSGRSRGEAADIDRGQLITPVAQMLSPTPEPVNTTSVSPNNLSVDEELSHLLADIANGP